MSDPEAQSANLAAFFKLDERRRKEERDEGRWKRFRIRQNTIPPIILDLGKAQDINEILGQIEFAIGTARSSRTAKIGQSPQTGVENRVDQLEQTVSVLQKKIDELSRDNFQLSQQIASLRDILTRLHKKDLEKENDDNIKLLTKIFGLSELEESKEDALKEMKGMLKEYSEETDSVDLVRSIREDEE